jgi:hypothetical protein
MPVSSLDRLADRATFDLLLHVLPASVGKILSIPGTVVLASGLLHEISGKAHRARPVRPPALDAAGIHLLKANYKHAIGCAVLHQRPGEVQARRASGTRVVGVVYWNACHAELVEDALS